MSYSSRHWRVRLKMGRAFRYSHQKRFEESLRSGNWRGALGVQGYIDDHTFLRYMGKKQRIFSIIHVPN